LSDLRPLLYRFGCHGDKRGKQKLAAARGEFSGCSDKAGATF
jgi:hypothetical protein